MVAVRPAPGGPRDGTVLVVVLAAMLVLSAVGLALTLVAETDRLASDNVGRAGASLYAADAAIERALCDLKRAPDWDAVLSGRTAGGFVDGPPVGPRTLADGRVVVLDDVVSLANCGRTGGCTDAAMSAVTADRPWGANNPRWSLFSYGPLSAMSSEPSPFPPREYVVVLVADDPAESDGDPSRDGEPGSGPGAGVILVRAEAFGPLETHRVVQAAVARGRPAGSGAAYAGQRGEGRSAGEEDAGLQRAAGSLSRTELSPTGGMSRQ
jgi:hypothetical protein